MLKQQLLHGAQDIGTVLAFARTQWRQQGYLDVEDYFAGILNTAMLEEMDRAGRIPARRAEDLDKL
jgi:hypothetical protein